MTLPDGFTTERLANIPPGNGATVDVITNGEDRLSLHIRIFGSDGQLQGDEVHNLHTQLRSCLRGAAQ